MGLFDRLSQLLRSNINDLISRAEDPEKMLNQILVDMRGQLVKAKQQVASAIADEKRLRDQTDAEYRNAEEWERRAMLAEHGKMARDYPDVRANTVASFALGDYEWMLAFEADELHRIVDLMRHLRGSTARRHVREEVPFYTGRRRSLPELVAALP